MGAPASSIDPAVWAAFFAENPDPSFVYAVGEAPEPRFTLVAANPAWLEVTGLVAADIFGKSLQQLMPPEAVHMIEPRLDRSVVERVHLTYEEELRFKNQTRYWRTTIAPVVIDGAVRYLICFGHDLTDLRDNVELERRLQKTQKLESLGVMAGGIAHDFNNLLTGILGHVGLMRLDPSCSPALQDSVTQVETAALRAAELCRQMLAYSGRGRLTMRRVELDALVLETTQLLSLSVSKNARVDLSLNAQGRLVEGDPGQLQQVIMNLVLNASEACEGKPGVVSIATGLESVRPPETPRPDRMLDLLEGQFVFLEVKDNGAGMTPQTQARMFDPFFTTKFTGRGLGLSAVLGIVRGHAGGVGVESEVGRGTKFRVLLPLAVGEPAPVSAATPQPRLQRTGTVLVVDDEEMVRTVTERILKSFGFQVVAARDGREAVDLVAAAKEPFAAVLMDLTMPNMDGVATFQELRRLHLDVPVILMSGHGEQDAVQRFAGQGLAGFIQKPFTPDMIRAQLALVLR